MYNAWWGGKTAGRPACANNAKCKQDSGKKTKNKTKQQQKKHVSSAENIYPKMLAVLRKQLCDRETKIYDYGDMELHNNSDPFKIKWHKIFIYVC